MARDSITYDDFSAGEYGRLGADKAPANSFTGRDIILTEAGLLSVRPGADDMGLSGVATGTVTTLGFNGTPGADLWYIQGNTVYARNGSAVAAMTGTLAVTPTTPVAWVESLPGITHITIDGDKCYKLDHVAKTVTALAGTPGGKSITVWGERLFVGGSTANPQRVWFSDAAAFGTFGASSFFDVAARAGVAAIFDQRDHLAIALASGEWWIARGYDPTSRSLRRATGLGAHPWVFNVNAAAVLPDNRIAYLPLGQRYPAFFNGSTVDDVRHLDTNTSGGSAIYDGPEDIRVLPGHRPDEAVFRFGQTLVLRHGVWTYHEFANGSLSHLTVSDRQGTIYMSDGGGVSTAPKFFRWRLDRERPGFASDSDTKPGDESATNTNGGTPIAGTVTFPRYWAPHGEEVRVRQVVVDFTKWNTGATPNLSMTLAVAPTGRFDLDGEGSLPTGQSWSEATSAVAAGEAGVPARQTFNVGDQGFGGGFQVSLTGLRGVAIKAVHVIFDRQPERPRA